MTNKKYEVTRRKFVVGSSALAAGTGALLAGCNPAPTPPRPPSPNPVTPGDGITIVPGNKALVYILLDGGNDSFNMLVPSSASAYDQYRTSRSNLALDKSSLLALNGFTDSNNLTFGLHPAMPKTQALFNTDKLAFVANVGPLIQPITKAEFASGAKPLPVGLMSHSDQSRHWMTANPGVRTNHGWFGKLADELQANKADSAISMNISMDGSNIAQNGTKAAEYAITQEGSVGLLMKESGKFPGQDALNRELLKGFDAIMSPASTQAFHETYADKTRHSQAQHETFKAAVDGVNIGTVFSAAQLSQQLKMVAKTIKAGASLGTEQQTFFIRFRGWDHHDELLKNHAQKLGVLDTALFEFQTALEELDVDDQVLTFTGSDFGRTLTSNGNGTDHGWGGVSIVMGKDVNGGKIYGEYPPMTLGSANPLDVGGGVLLPTTSADELFAELAIWFGVQKGDLAKLFPNLPHFYNHLKAKDAPLGLVGT
ncbi:Uncharacterised protein [BD1-7 clade bacterium]|uniref:DUF1501 domain-containing protein n=1 Tax=BD1-7 clade bacterium TaxID=2029982 RepID=A0A5S9PKJ8_9GAMM|nr:Uncharacterised protein [BD1-7 clade bacterium]